MKLAGRIQTNCQGEPFIVRLTDVASLPVQCRGSEALLLRVGQACPSTDGYAAVVSFDQGLAAGGDGSSLSRWVYLPSEFSYLVPGDIIRVNPYAQAVNVLYRRQSRSNSLLLTEQCNSNCIMCSQPPRDIDDSFIVDEILKAIPLMAPETPELGITGGEPTLAFDGLVRVIGAARDCLPATALHVLSNGRLFAYRHVAERVAGVNHPDLMFGVPLYSDVPYEHEFVVQARGAFDQTVRGILNLGRYGVKVEVRVVIHRHTYRRLPSLARFIARNLPFVANVAFMGLEMMGYVKMNLESLWIDPVEYQQELCSAVETLDRAGLRASIYNHQICVLERQLWPFACKSISDWKNIYLECCDQCAVKDECGGFFASAQLRHSRHIRPIVHEHQQVEVHTL